MKILECSCHFDNLADFAHAVFKDNLNFWCAFEFGTKRYREQVSRRCLVDQARKCLIRLFPQIEILLRPTQMDPFSRSLKLPTIHTSFTIKSRLTGLVVFGKNTDQTFIAYHRPFISLKNWRHFDMILRRKSFFDNWNKTPGIFLRRAEGGTCG